MTTIDRGPGSDYTAAATAAMHAALEQEPDFADCLARALATIAAMKGSGYALISGRPGSWEADHVINLVRGTVGHDDDHLPDYLPEGFAPPVTGAALYAGEDGTLYLAASVWDDGRDGDVYVRETPLRRGEDLWTDVVTWAAQGVTPGASGDWRKLSDNEATEIRRRAVAELRFVARVDVGVAGYDRSPDPAAYPDNVRYYIDEYSIEQEEYAAEDAIRSQPEELAAVAEWPGSVQRHATSLAEAPDGAGWAADLDDPAEVTACYQQAMRATAADDAARARVTDIKASYDAWRARWRADPQHDHGSALNSDPARQDAPAPRATGHLMCSPC
jgi:hypothetical protein